ncbi:MAG: peptide deformylase [Mariprofundaceae bacterium]
MRDIIRLPDVRLRQKAAEVEVFDANLRALLDEMGTLMEHGPGGVGIAASQLGELVRAIVVDCSLAQHSCKNHGRLCMINPQIIEQSGKVLGREGCLSVPEWVGTVSRSKKITLAYQDGWGDKHQLQSTSFEARVIQHELDHLDGVLFIDRVLSTHDLVRRMER